MENFFSRYKNPLVLMAVLFIQIVALATQIKRPDSARGPSSGSTRLIRVWTVTVITPFEQILVGTGHFFRTTWNNYIGLRDVRKQNRELQEQLARMRMEEARLKSGADESQRLRALLDFKDRYVGKTLAAEIIGTSGTDSLHAFTIDKGSHAGVKPGMAVITPDGIVGKVKEVFTFSSQVLMINDRESGAGVVLENSRLRGILRGIGHGDLQVSDIMSDEKVDIGEQVVTSGGDGVYPKGFPVGTVTKISNDTERGPFLAVKIKSAASLDRLDEVLVVTRIAEEAPSVAADTTPVRAADILSQRLPSVSKPADSSPGGTNNPATVSPVTAKPGLQPDQKKEGSSVQVTGAQAAGSQNRAGSAVAGRAGVEVPSPAKASPSPSPKGTRTQGTQTQGTQTQGIQTQGPQAPSPGHGQTAIPSAKGAQTQGPQASSPARAKGLTKQLPPAHASDASGPQASPSATPSPTPGGTPDAKPGGTPDAKKAKTPSSTLDPEKPPQ